ncbi:TPA: hypothetical protein QDZ34_000121 [Stenotrophomonas maltophilia]|nr:hypothetical protein [Stenotrophomonas maltophilia]HDS1024057.1 hypothetical protein [Stenotrophomonas maltophilia]HDS1028448.1 hypothetical protein [Stenotrophomonas maltophilia]HDS1032820.1 hypothetical protein [Stenotrophomonas maltophilia]
MGKDTPFLEQAPHEGLTFHGLYSRVQGLSSQSSYPKAGSVEKWSYRVGVAAALFGLATGLLLDRWIPAGLLLPLALTCLVIEIVGFLAGGVLTLRREYRQYAQPRLSHAKEMDSEFLHWQAVIAELRMFPRDAREQRLRYIQALRTGMTERMGIMYGGLQRLGPFPLLIALYLQFRNWRPGDWMGVFDIGWAAALLIFAMAMLYLLGWVLIAQRTRLDTYVSLLEASLQESTK